MLFYDDGQIQTRVDCNLVIAGSIAIKRLGAEMCEKYDKELHALRALTFKLSVIGLPGWAVLVVTRRDVTSSKESRTARTAREFREVDRQQ